MQDLIDIMITAMVGRSYYDTTTYCGDAPYINKKQFFKIEIFHYYFYYITILVYPGATHFSLCSLLHVTRLLLLFSYIPHLNLYVTLVTRTTHIN